MRTVLSFERFNAVEAGALQTAAKQHVRDRSARDRRSAGVQFEASRIASEPGRPCVTNASPRGLRSCMEDEGQALRSRLSGAGFKPPQAASVKSRCRERWRKRYRSGVDHGDERERTPDDVSKGSLATSKPGAGLSPGTRLGGAR